MNQKHENGATTLSKDLPFKSSILQGLGVNNPMIAKLEETEYAAACRLIDYLFNRVDKQKFVKWSFDVLKRLSMCTEDKDASYILSSIGEVYSSDMSIEDVIRTFNGIADYGMNLTIKEVTQAYFVYIDTEAESDAIGNEEFVNYFSMLRHLVEINEILHDYSWAGRRMIHSVTEAA